MKVNAIADVIEKADVRENVKLVDPKEVVFENGLTLDQINNIEMTKHAYDRAVERFSIKDRKKAKEFVKESLKKSMRIGLVIAVDGNQSLCFSYEGNAFYMSLDHRIVFTIAEGIKEQVSYVASMMEDIRKEMVDIQMKKMRRLQRMHKKLSKEVEENYYDYKVEIAELERKIYKTSSNHIKDKSRERIIEIDEAMKVEKKELEQIEIDMRMLSKSIIAVNQK